MGFFGGWVDMLLMRFVEIMMCFPTLAFILIVVSIFGKNIFLIIVALAIVSWTAAARLVRGQFLQERAQDYVTAARALGIPTRRIVFKHILPNAIHPVFITATFGVAGAILLEASLAFLGLGDARVPSWGQILLEGRTTQKLWLILSPGVAIFLTVTVLNLVGEGVRDALDPKLRQ
jgi:peptide/nickel transport system permease protein